VEGVLTGIVLLAVWVLVLRHHSALVPVITATGAAFGGVRAAVVGAHPGATLGSVIGAVAVIAASWWWFKRLTSDSAYHANTHSPAEIGDDVLKAEGVS
jgi:hydroxyethylthiazole kinase-like sugar kinase family protein